MKTIISIGLLILMTFSIFLKVGIIISWKLNQDYIANNLCINKDKPKMACKGKCHLKAQLQKVDRDSQQDKNDEDQKTKMTSIDVFIEANHSAFVAKNYIPLSNGEYTEKGNLYDYCFCTENIKPPGQMRSC